MNEEEKQSIEWLKRLVKLNKRDNLDDTFAEILLNLVEKQQKEIEQLDKKFQYAVSVDVINDLYINKDKIRKFIEEYLPDDEIMEICSVYDVNGILIREKLEKLLGE